MGGTITTEENVYEYNNKKPYKDSDLLEKLYWDENMSQREIADVVGCAAMTVCRWMDKLDVEAKRPTNERVPYFYTSEGYEHWKTRIDKDLKQVKVHRLLAVAEFGFDAVCGKDVHHENHIPWDNRGVNIELKTHSEHTKDHNNKRNKQAEWKDKDKLKELYIEKELSTVEIAEKWNCATATVSRWLDIHGIDARSLSEAQKNRYNDS